MKGATLWNEAFYLVAEDLYKGGTGILLSSKIATMVIDYGIISSGRAEHLTIQWTKNITLGIINVYAYNHTGPRAHLSNTIKNFPLPLAQWIMAGDFNRVKSLDDKLGRNPTIGRGCKELKFWHDLLCTLDLRDTFLVDEFRKLKQPKNGTPGITDATPPTWSALALTDSM